MRGARPRWKIENEAFNTLKNRGYHFGYNFGHGHQHRSTVLMLAFLIDQDPATRLPAVPGRLARGTQQRAPVAQTAHVL